MPLIIDVKLRHGLRQDAGKAHTFVFQGCSQTETRTLYHVHDLEGKHMTIVTDDLRFTTDRWGLQAREVKMREYNPQPSVDAERQFLIRLNRERRKPGEKPFQTDDDLDYLLTRLMDRAGAEVLEYEARTDAGYRLNSKTANIPTATFQGLLRVKDSSLMRQTLLQGLGRTKRYGCGLLLTTAPQTL